MLTDDLRKHGWREMPDEATRRRWEDAGGRWMVTFHPHQPAALELRPVVLRRTDPSYDMPLWRPVHPDHGWSHFPWMWAQATSESLVPTEPGLCWFKFDVGELWHVVDVDHRLGWSGLTFKWVDTIETVDGSPTSDQRWGGPCVGSPGDHR